MQATDRGGEAPGIVGNEGVLAVDQTHTFRTDRRGDDGDSVSHRVPDLPLHTGAVAKGSDKDLRAPEEIGHVGQETRDLQPIGRQTQQLLWRVGSESDELEVVRAL